MIRKHVAQAIIFLSFGVLSAALQGCGLIETLGRAGAEGYLELCEPVFVVNKTEDTSDGICTTEDCSLRDAIVMANACEGEQTIQLSPLTYTITRDGAGENDAITGDFDIKDDLIIEGSGAVIDGARLDRVFDVRRTEYSSCGCPDLELIDLTIQNGEVSGNGGGINIQGALGGVTDTGEGSNLHLSEVTFLNNSNSPRGSGGAIYAGLNTSLIAENIRFINNSASQGGGAIYAVGGTSIRMVGSLLDGNSSGSAGSGGAISIWGGDPIVFSRTTFRGNSSSHAGGAIFIDSGDVEIIDGVIEMNESVEFGGGIYRSRGNLSVIGTSLIGNMSTEGGAIYSNIGEELDSPPHLTISDSIVEDNRTSDSGAAIVTKSSASILNSTIRGNQNGSISNYGQLSIRDSTISGNIVAGDASAVIGGAAIHNEESAELLLTNVTLSGHSATSGFAAVIENIGGTVDLNHVTIFENELTGLSNPFPSGTISLQNSIVAHSRDSNCASAISSGGHNLLDDDTCGTASALGDILHPTTLLSIGSLEYNRGPTFTHALLPGSPAIDAAGDRCPATDQRGVSRPQGDACDIGAFEADFETESMSIIAATAEATETPMRTSTSTSTLTPQPRPITPTPTITPKPPTPTFTHQPPPPTHTPTATLKPSPPAAPIQLTITKKVCTDKEYSVTLVWMDVANNEVGYRVYRDKDLIATLKGNSTSYTDKPPGSGPYTYGVEAFNNAGASGRPTVFEEGCLY
ncbi:MAG: CSLREA domain-containing protein [Anaerolineales bacterium]|nr:CSLREA domain-containing protein [Anaerolineales bacterium]